MIGWGILGAVVWTCVALWPAMVAKNKGHSFLGWFLISILFWWISLFWVYFGLKDKTKSERDIADEKAAVEAVNRDERS
jgi:hypothetical protein